jgi:hypothetical protein
MSTATTLIAHPEPAIPAEYKASDWLSWSQVQTVAYMLGVSKEFDVAENFAVSNQLQKMIAAGVVQKWKKGSHQSAPAYYRMIWK